jgi:RND family efflux transporter MFP subunit
LAGGARVQNSTFTYNGNLSKPMPWYGGTAALTFNNNRAVNNGSSLNTFNPSYQTTFTLGYTQPLMRNFKIDSTRQNLQTTQISRELADVNLKAVITSTLASVKNAYWDYVYATQAVDVARQSLQLAEKLVEDNQTKVEIGTLAPLDVVVSQSEAATRRQTLAQAEGTLRTAELALKRLIVSGTQDRLWNATLNPVDRADFKPEPIDVDAAVRVALEQRTDLIQARRNIESSEVSLKYLGNQKLPQLDVTASYGLQGIGGNQLLRTVDPNNPVGGLVTTTIPGGYVDALHILRQGNYPSWNVQMTFSYPLGTSTADAQVASAKVRLTQSQAQLRASELSVATEVTNAGLTVQSNLKRVEAAMVARDLAQQRLDAEQAKFEVGMSTNFLVVQAQRDLRDAQNVELRAVLDYRKSLVDFERAQFTRAGTSGSAASARAAAVRAPPRARAPAAAKGRPEVEAVEAERSMAAVEFFVDDPLFRERWSPGGLAGAGVASSMTSDRLAANALTMKTHHRRDRHPARGRRRGQGLLLQGGRPIRRSSPPPSPAVTSSKRSGRPARWRRCRPSRSAARCRHREALYADFNSIVKKGQLIAKIDPQLIQTQIEQAQANFARSQADLERLKVTLADAQSKLKRAEGLAVKRLIPDSELETAQVNVRMAEAQLRSSQAALTQAQASLNQNMVNLQNTDIFAPIDGIVISRNVDQGQTVAASFNAPTLFIIAADLTRMQARASVDEADVGLMRPGQTARFRVDAYPLDEFTGTVSQVRLQPVVSQNVVTYVTVIDVPNPNLKLKPGMTANVTSRSRGAGTRCGSRMPPCASARRRISLPRSTSRCRRRCSRAQALAVAQARAGQERKALAVSGRLDP